MGEARRRKLSGFHPATRVNDYATEVWKIGGRLEGGKIALVVFPGVLEDHLTFRILTMRLHHNDAPGEITCVRLRTSQPAPEIIDIARLGALVNITVDWIDDEESVIKDGGQFRLVHGMVKPLAHFDPNGGLLPTKTMLPDMTEGFAYHPGLNALVTCIFDANENPVHVHMLCLTETGAARASYQEAQHRFQQWRLN
jgi:hypothetical protein